VAALEEAFDHMGSDESRSAGNEDFHLNVTLTRS
jgi:hypothetical protein